MYVGSAIMCAMNQALPSTGVPAGTTLAIFCRVVDNYGDIGICWRFARQLHHEHGIDVCLWVDDLVSFRRLHPPVDTGAQLQTQAGVTVRHWRAQEGAFQAHEVADIVIEFFACDIPEGYITAMAQCDPRPVWLNFEGLTAEEWVEGCHRLLSPHPRLKLTKHFFFPGFTARTGGLLRERDLLVRRRQFQNDPAARSAFLDALGVRPQEQDATLVSLFCYPHAPVSMLFEAWSEAGRAIACLVPDGVARESVAAFLGAAALPGAAATRGSLSVRVIPFLAQDDYDRLLWACDLNFVRGEDSWVRAQWAGRPFIWHIYPQDENLHHKKLRAFLARYAGDLGSLATFALRWNGAAVEAEGESEADAPGWGLLSARLLDELPRATRRTVEWEAAMAQHGDMAGNLLRFAASLRQFPQKTRV